MRLNPYVTAAVAVVAAATLLFVSARFIQPSGPVLQSAEFSLSAISPNGDGTADITRITYQLRRSARVSIYFTDSQGKRYDFRSDNPRDPGEHSLLFSGIVDAYALPDDHNLAQLLKRVLQDGHYTWVVEAVEPGSDPVKITGPLDVSGADTRLPDLKNLSASPVVFSPNQDGINDRVTINVWLDKDIPDSNLHVYLLGPDGARYPMAETGTNILPGRRGLHSYDWDGGIDNGLVPPPDGDYQVRADVEDLIGQQLTIETPLSIRNSGLPRAEIYLGRVKWSSHKVPLGQALSFELTVINYGTAPLRTFGPWSGTQYQQPQNENSLGFYDQDGAWRIGISCDSCIHDYPWRFGLGDPSTLTQLTENGESHYYLMPGQQTVVRGSIVLTQVVESRNPQYFFAGLIHEAVGIDNINNRVGAWQVTIGKP